MSESGSGRTPWRRIIAEGAAILVSILLAFWIDAWWDGRQEEEELAESLAALRVGVLENRTRLDSAIAQNGRRVAGADAALRLTPAEIRSLPGDSVLSLSVAIGTYAPYNPTNAAFEAFLSANLLEAIPDLELRTAIAGWRGLERNPELTLDFLLEIATWAARRHIELRIDTSSPECWAEFEETPLTDFESCGVADFLLTNLTDPDLRAIVGMRQNVLEGYVGLLRELEEPMDNLISLLSAEP